MSVGICDSNEGALDGPLDDALDGGVEKERRFTKGVATVMRECTARGKEDLGDGTAFTCVQDGAENMRDDIRNTILHILKHSPELSGKKKTRTNKHNTLAVFFR